MDELTVPQLAATTGRRFVRLPRRVLRAMGPESRMFFWFRESGYQADIPALRRCHPGLLTAGMDGHPPMSRRVAVVLLS
ncbi:hypothetical protein [Nocardia sp. CDC153]|uniref:hypothetical protein n=1 Tax=Nocardia sp. CDC153 TaxID=3112167 RepID=UPI003FA37C5D